MSRRYERHYRYSPGVHKAAEFDAPPNQTTRLSAPHQLSRGPASSGGGQRQHERHVLARIANCLCLILGETPGRRMRLLGSRERG